MKMEPVLVERIWGGRRLAELFGKPLAPGVRVGESWELSDHPHGRSRVADGPLAGRTLREVLERHGPAVLGPEGLARGWGERFGLLIKFIDAADRLSVQVHPDDACAAALAPGERGKTECWVVVRAEPGAWLIHGLVPGVTREALAAAIAERPAGKAGRLEELLARRPVRAGDFIWVPAGTVHAIGPGLVLAEIQQSSDLTYRVFDWNRRGEDGAPRSLHVREALQVIRFSGDGPPPGGRGKTVDEPGLTVEHLADCTAFGLSRVCLAGRSWAGRTGGECAAAVVLDGAGRLASGSAAMPVRAGDTVLVPAECGQYVLEASEPLTVLVAAPPGKAPVR
ncbi:MAG: class I mannose-6-phosphate isomerase [Planctomycetes bacterium]|nr:class I mannose-6-phosphate isomerase [Planctomycetota bacterium]